MRLKIEHQKIRWFTKSAGNYKISGKITKQREIAGLFEPKLSRFYYIFLVYGQLIQIFFPIRFPAKQTKEHTTEGFNLSSINAFKTME